MAAQVKSSMSLFGSFCPVQLTCSATREQIENNFISEICFISEHCFTAELQGEETLRNSQNLPSVQRFRSLLSLSRTKEITLLLQNSVDHNVCVNLTLVNDI